MLRIRLRRVGKKKQPSYRIVVADARAPRDGAIVEQVGHYNPLTDPPTVVVDADKVKHWLGVGAQPSDTVGRILQSQGIVEKAAS
jgi:small subunit ribosomal protein S16